MPKEVIITSVIFPVEYYYGRIAQCYNCLHFGHISKQCRSGKKLCISCGKEKSENHTCEASDMHCINCRSPTHKSIYKDCPIYKKQVAIRKIMIENQLSFHEAEGHINNSFSNAVHSNRFNILANENSEENSPPS